MKCMIMLLAIFACSLATPTARADSIQNSPHDLSSSSAARIKSTDTRICIFCHTPHHSTILSDPFYPGALWSREENLKPYQPYASATMLAVPGQPQGASRLCLSCHDGTVALTAHATAAQLQSLDTIYLTSPPPFPKKSAVLGTDLRGDHPVSMPYGLKAGEFKAVADVTNTPVKLVARDGTLYVECTSCHNPHDNKYGNFLVVDTTNQHDALCTACHVKSGWADSVHKSGGTKYPTVSASVAESGCINCHTPHGAQRGESLLTLPAVGAGIDTNCYNSCHKSAPYFNVFDQFNAPGRYTHPLTLDSDGSKHSEPELLPLATADKHVHCVDCHNPHKSSLQNSPLANAPTVSGAIQGVRGVDKDGDPVAAAPYEYQICFKCHSGDHALAGGYNDNSIQVQRIFTSMDERKRFDATTAMSRHPVSQSGVYRDSLINAAMRTIYCSDCHNSHGSEFPHMLKLGNPDLFSTTLHASYPLCYSCHDVDYLLTNDPNTDRLNLHKTHVLGRHDPASLQNNYVAPCAACHDPHGVPSDALTTAANSLHLVNFDRRWVGAESSYDATNKSCFISGPGTNANCHPSTINPAVYNSYPYTPP